MKHFLPVKVEVVLPLIQRLVRVALQPAPPR